MAVAIVSDTCHYLPREVVAEHGIHEVSLYVHGPEGTVRESEISDYDHFYEQLRSAPELPSTSQPSIGDFLAVYEPLLDAGQAIVSIHLAGGMSGTVRSAGQAREQLGPRAADVHVVDSQTACGGEGLVVLAAAAAARNGADGAAVAARALRARAELKMWFAIDTLEYLRRGGRIAGAQAWLGSALRIKPILTVESEITPVERVRTSRRAFERMVDLLHSRAQDGADGWMVQHIQAPREAAELAARGTELFGKPPRVVSEIGPVIGAHVGPGLLGAGGIPSSLL
ncbi:MAG: DegV family protein [Solirubrobacterales bacterium]|nr:DegV family protein [Solirubrobacterales bacterium]MBV9473637.1 DegV family protein [Solirubrobacterales bacterium]MBV9839429.1 DegV family protein [Solirubrobacterales bacterium]